MLLLNDREELLTIIHKFIREDGAIVEQLGYVIPHFKIHDEEKQKAKLQITTVQDELTLYFLTTQYLENGDSLKNYRVPACLKIDENNIATHYVDGTLKKFKEIFIDPMFKIVDDHYAKSRLEDADKNNL